MMDRWTRVVHTFLLSSTPQLKGVADDDVDQTLPRKKAWQFCLAL